MQLELISWLSDTAAPTEWQDLLVHACFWLVWLVPDIKTYSLHTVWWIYISVWPVIIFICIHHSVAILFIIFNNLEEKYNFWQIFHTTVYLLDTYSILITYLLICFFGGFFVAVFFWIRKAVNIKKKFY